MNRLKTFNVTAALAAASLALSASAWAQGTPSSTMAAPAGGSGTASNGMASGGGALGSADQKFVMEAAKGGMAEVALGQLAQQKGSSDSVKQFGAKMVDDHTKANDELKQLASAKSVTLPTSPPKDAKAQKLVSMSGAAFDRAYMAQMLADHKKTVALFQKESSTGKDPELKAFAAKTLPTLQAHLQMVQSDEHTASGAMKH